MKLQIFSTYRLMFLINSIWALPAVLLIRVIRPLVLIRICKIFSERIGHFTADIAEHLARQNFKQFHTLDFFYFGTVSNKQWEKMARRSSLSIVAPWFRYLDRWNQLIPGGSAHVLKSSLTQSRDTEGLFERFNATIPFLPEENELALKWLTSKGWTFGEPFICLLVRDSKFLEAFRTSSADANYHDYRDSDIRTYLTAMGWLSSQGVWVLRMGKSMAHPLQSISDRIIDYAFDAQKSDLLDIWLFANCSGVISTATGLDQLAMIYRKPQLYVNAMPLGSIHTWSRMIWVPKNLRWGKSKQPLSISQYLEHSYYQLNEYASAGIEIIDLSSDEILMVVKEFWWKICGSWDPTEVDAEKQKRFWEIFKSWAQYDKMHGVHHPNAVVGNDWLLPIDDEALN